MPYEHWGCSVCGKQVPKKYREHGMFSERMKWLRKHYKSEHPKKYKEWYK